MPVDGRASRRTLPLAFVAFVLLAAMVFVACGSSDDNGSTGGGSATSGESSGDAAELKGKTIGYIDVFATAPIEKRFYKAFEEAAGHVGWDVQLQDTAGEQAKAVTAARNFINSGVDAIVTSSIPSEWLRPVVADAESKDIPIVELITKGEPGVYTAEVLEAQEETSAALAEKVGEDFPEGVQLGITLEPEIQAEPERLEGLEAAVEGTKTEIAAIKEIPQIEAPAAQKATIDMLNADPNLGAFISLSSIQPSYVLAGIRAAGNKEAKLYGWYADSANASLLKQNPQFAALVDSDIAKVSWVATGELLDYFSGGELQQQQFINAKPVIVEKADITPGMLQDEGPVPFEQIGAPFYEEWESEYGIGG